MVDLIRMLLKLSSMAFSMIAVVQALGHMGQSGDEFVQAIGRIRSCTIASHNGAFCAKEAREAGERYQASEIEAVKASLRLATKF